LISLVELSLGGESQRVRRDDVSLKQVTPKLARVADQNAPSRASKCVGLPSWRPPR
jgi:hypothetical protein